MNKVFIFSLCNGTYEYSICFIQAESLEEAVKIGNAEPNTYIGLQGKKVQGHDFNYQYKSNIDKFSYLNYSQQLPSDWNNNSDLVINHPIFKKSYKELLELAPASCKSRLLNNEEYITVKGEFWDVMECLMPVPKGYIYSNGHSG